MPEVGRPSGLVKRQGSANWHFRQRWPKRYQRPGTPAQIWISLGTASYAEALTRIEEARREAHRCFTTPQPLIGIYSRSPRSMWPDDDRWPLLELGQVKLLAVTFFSDAMRAMDAGSVLPSDVDPEAIVSWQQELETRLARLTGSEPADGIDDIDGAQIAVLRKAAVRSEPGSEACNLLHNYLRRASAQLCKIELARLRGDYSDQITDSAFLSLPPHNSPSSRPSDVTRATPTTTTALDPELVDLWAAERKVSAKGIDKHRAVARWFGDYIGVMPVETITKRDVIGFKNRLVIDGVSPANANAKLSCLRTLLGYAVENLLLTENPADGVSVHDKDKNRRKRKEFELPALHALFGSPVYAADERPTSGRGEAAYWMPLIALYTGARLEEIAQLRVTDVREESYLDGEDVERLTWFICVMQEGDLSTKNAESERRIPVHPDLVRLGFVRHVQSIAATVGGRIFPALRPNKYGRLGAKWGEWWSGYRREVCGITDRRVVFHSFRHTFKYYARHVGMIEGVQRRIMGHSPGDTADEYAASGYSLHQLVEGMKLYRIPGLVLPPPPPDCR